MGSADIQEMEPIAPKSATTVAAAGGAQRGPFVLGAGLFGQNRRGRESRPIRFGGGDEAASSLPA